jgi:hypothetical protein
VESFHSFRCLIRLKLWMKVMILRPVSRKLRCRVPVLIVKVFFFEIESSN